MAEDVSNLIWERAALPEGTAFAVLEHVGHPLFVKDRDFRFVLLNQALADMLGYDRRDMLGKTDYDFFPKAEADYFRQRDEELFRSGQTVTIPEEFITDAAGKRHVLATTKVALRDASGKISHLVGVIHDITRLKEAEDALRLMNETLEQRVAERTHALEVAKEQLYREERLALVGRLASGLAHHLRNPLGTIINTVALLRRKGAVASPEALRILDDEAWAASRMLGQLVEVLARSGSAPVTVRLPELMDQALGAVTIPPQVEVARAVPDINVRVDAQDAANALTNLLRNAVEAMPAGGRLQVSAREDPDMVVVRITDTGPGIPRDLAANLFAPVLSAKRGGMGLGLTTAKLLIEAQGGQLVHVPEVKGACFELSLPR